MYLSLLILRLIFFFSNFFFLLHVIHPSICLSIHTFSQRNVYFSYRIDLHLYPPSSPQFSCARRHGMRVERWRVFGRFVAILVYRGVGRQIVRDRSRRQCAIYCGIRKLLWIRESQGKEYVQFVRNESLKFDGIRAILASRIIYSSGMLEEFYTNLYKYWN